MENIKHLQKLAEVFDTDKIITSDEIEQVLKGILVIMNSFKKDNQTLNKETTTIVENLLTKVVSEHEKLKDDVSQITSSSENKISSKLESTLEEVKGIVKQINAIERPKDGKDADEEKIIESVLSQIKLPEQKETILDTPEEIADKLESLKGDNRLDASAIKNLPEIKGGKFYGGSGIKEIIAGTGVTVDNTNLGYPVVSSTGGGGGHVIEEEGTPLTQRANLNFVGAGVSVADTGGKTVVTINGGGGTIDGSGTTNELTYWVDSDTLGTLATATYPSLTELSYVKGVTSAIQTQLNAKLTSSNIVETITNGVTTNAPSENAVFDALALKEPLKGVDDNYVTDAQLIVIGNTSGTNTGDQTISNSSDATSHTVTLSASGGSVQLIEGSGITLTTGGTGSAGTVTIAASGGGGDMVLASAQTNSGVKTFLDTTMKLRNVANTFDGYFVNTNTADRIYTLQNASGTLAFLSDITGINSGTNTGDQTSIVGITGTKAQFDTACTDGDFLYVGDVTSNATHTGDATGSGALTVVAINGTNLAALGTGILKNTTATGVPSIAIAGDFPTLNQNTTGSAATLTTTRTIWGQNFNGGANVTGTLALGTADLTLTGSIGATGARATKVWTAAIESTAMPTVGGTAILTSLTAPQFTTIELGHATDTTLSRVSAGVIAVEGKTLANLTDGGTFIADISVPDEAYGSGWDSSTEVPTKNAVYDKIETLSYTPAYLGITATPNSAQTTVANTAYTLAITVPVACTITKVAVYIGTSSGNIDVGIYNSSGTRLGSSGSVASPGTGSRLISLSSSVDLTPGFYYLAVAADNATISLGRYSTDNLLGSGAVATSFPLPSTLTTPIAVSSRAYSIAGVVSGGVTQ